MPVKRTPEDDAFAAAFGELLEKAYDTSKLNKITDQEFAESIGVERPQLRKYFRGVAVPSIRTVAMAQRKYGINVPYANVMAAKGLGAKGRQRTSVPLQLRLPFSLEVADPSKFEVQLKALRPGSYELSIRSKGA
jgi:transcriptional regulator with XRE-family HTH domain